MTTKFNVMDTNDKSKIVNQIKAIDFKLQCIQETAEGLTIDLNDQIDIDLVLNFINIKDIKDIRDNKTTSKLDRNDLIGVMRFSMGNSNANTDFYVEPLTSSEGLCFLGMYRNLLLMKRKKFVKELSQEEVLFGE